MSLDFHFIQVVKTRDAIAVYVHLLRQGNIGETSYERLALDLKAAGLGTSRGADFTAAVVRAKLAELQEIGAVSLEKVSKNAFRISLTTYADDDTNDAESQEKSVSVENQNEFVVQNEESPRARGEEVLIINNNKNINKKINKTNPEILTTEEKAPVVPEDTIAEDAAENVQPSTDELRERIDWNQSKVAAYRAAIVQQCWEPGINPDLIDRVAALAILKIDGFDSKRVAVILREASEARALYERSAGRYGSPTLWKALCYTVKRIYEGAGWKWIATRIANEPKPTVAQRVAVPQGIDARRQFVEKAVPSEPTSEPISATSSASSFVYTDEECLGDFDSLAQLIRSREGISQWEAQGRAYALRNERRSKQRMSV